MLFAAMFLLWSKNRKPFDTMNTLFSDYSKPAYYYRLFHEGRPWEGRVGNEISKMVKKWNQNSVSGRWMMGLGETTTPELASSSTVYREKVAGVWKDPIKPVICDEILADDLFLDTLAGKPATTVDPLDGVW